MDDLEDQALAARVAVVSVALRVVVSALEPARAAEVRKELSVRIAALFPEAMPLSPEVDEAIPCELAALLGEPPEARPTR